MSQPDEPNPYAPSQVDAQAEMSGARDSHGIAELQIVVGRFRATRSAMEIILGVIAGVWLLLTFSIGGLAALLAVVPGGLAIGYARCWKPAIQAGVMITAAFVVSPLFIYAMVWIFGLSFELVMVTGVFAVPALPVLYVTTRCLQFANRILAAGYPLTVTSLEIIHAQATETGELSD